MTKSFEFCGKIFTPHRKFTKAENRAGLLVVGNATGISNYKGLNYRVHNHISDQWNYDKFYTAAGHPKVDVFLMDGKEVVPCENELFEIAKIFQAEKEVQK